MNKLKLLFYQALTLGLASPLIAHAKLENPLGTTDVNLVVANVIRALLGVTGSIALLMFIWGGLLWLTSGGQPEKVKKGKETLKWALLGLVVIFFAYTAINFVLDALSGASCQPPNKC